MFKKVYLLFLGVIIQIYILQFLYHSYFFENVNSLLLFNVYGLGVSYQLLYQAYSYFFFGMVSFYFMGSMKKHTEYYGVFQLYRGKGNLTFLGFHYFKTILGISAVLLLETTLFIIYNLITNMGLKFIITQSEVKGLILWLLTFTALIMLQMTLELFMDDTIAVVLINIYVLISIALGSVLLERGSSLLYLLIHNFSMYLRSDELYPESPLEFMTEIIILIIIMISCFCISLVRLRKKDYLE